MKAIFYLFSDNCRYFISNGMRFATHRDRNRFTFL